LAYTSSLLGLRCVGDYGGATWAHFRQSQFYVFTHFWLTFSQFASGADFHTFAQTSVFRYASVTGTLMALSPRFSLFPHVHTSEGIIYAHSRHTTRLLRTTC